MSMQKRGFLDFSAPRPDLRPFVEDDSAISWQGDGGHGCGCEEGGPPSQFDGLLETAVRTGPPVTADWSLLRKFADFWPSDMSAPPEFPWLATLVDRKKAWRWVSQFPRFFEDVEYWHTETIQQFIARTLTEVEPTTSSGEQGDKSCCKPRSDPKPPLPPPDADLPEEPKCQPNNWWDCLACPEPGEGMYIYQWPDCSIQKTGGCVFVPDECGDPRGPIDPEDDIGSTL